MKAPLKMTLMAALPLAALLWMTPPAVAHDGYRSHEPHRSWSASPAYRHPSYGRSHEWEQRRSYNSSWQYGKNSQQYNKAMNRLARQEREAQEKAYHRYEGNRNNPRFRERLAEIDRKYDQKRYQVERNLRND
jgi:hypothetical protein